MPERGEKELYFIVRAIVLNGIAGLLFLTSVGILGTIDLIGAILVGFFIFIAALLISKLFEREIDWLVLKMLAKLERHKRLKKFILTHF